MTDSIRIVHFLNWCREGGTVGMIMSLMRRSKHQHTYLTFEASEQRRNEFNDLGLSLVEVGENGPAAIEFIKENADILHAAHSGGPEPGMQLGCDAGKPVVVTCQSPNVPVSPGEISENCPFYVVPVSEGIADCWSNDFSIARVIYSCAEPIPKHSKEDSKRRFGLDPTRPVVGRVGRLEGMKRGEDFVHISQYIYAKRPDIQFLLVGDGSDGPGLRYAVRKSRVPVVMPGYLRGFDKELAYNAIDVFLYPTTVEGFGIVFAEAMSLGIPIVTYTDPVNVDVVRDAGVYGIDNLFVIDIEHPWGSMASLTLDLLKNKREYDKLSRNGLRLYKQKYTPDRLTMEYDELYEEIFARHCIV